jgi:hypothetical protein
MERQQNVDIQYDNLKTLKAYLLRVSVFTAISSPDSSSKSNAAVLLHRISGVGLPVLSSFHLFSDLAI